MVDRERTLFQLNDAQRAQLAHTVDTGFGDEMLAAERARVAALAQACPGLQRALAVSDGDSIRDAIRERAHGDGARLAQVANVALADWFARRAADTQDRTFCDRANVALSAQAQTQTDPGEATTSRLLDRLPVATVTRDVGQPPPAVTTDPPTLTVSNYALGQTTAVSAAAPLPQYLAVVYGGTLMSASDARPGRDARTAARLVDREAPSFRDWEPDALYVALRGGHL